MGHPERAFLPGGGEPERLFFLLQNKNRERHLPARGRFYYQGYLALLGRVDLSILRQLHGAGGLGGGL